MPHPGLACDGLAVFAEMLASPCQQRGYMCSNSPRDKELDIIRAT